MSDVAKAVKFCAGSLDDLRAFPSSARRDAGYELDKVQTGRNPSDWKPMNAVGAGLRELRIRDASGAYRVLYVSSSLHGEVCRDSICIALSSEEDAGDEQIDLDLAAKRYRDLVKELGR